MELKNKLIQESTSPGILWYSEKGVGTSLAVWQYGNKYRTWTWDDDDVVFGEVTILGPSCLAHW